MDVIAAATGCLCYSPSPPTGASSPAYTPPDRYNQYGQPLPDGLKMTWAVANLIRADD
jgi:hypothetical protein